MEAIPYLIVILVNYEGGGGERNGAIVSNSSLVNFQSN